MKPITMSVPKGSNPMTEKQAERIIALLEQIHNRLGALLPVER